MILFHSTQIYLNLWCCNRLLRNYQIWQVFIRLLSLVYDNYSFQIWIEWHKDQLHLPYNDNLRFSRTKKETMRLWANFWPWLFGVINCAGKSNAKLTLEDRINFEKQFQNCWSFSSYSTNLEPILNLFLVQVLIWN